MIRKSLAVVFALCAWGIPVQAQAPPGTIYIESNIGHVPGQNSILGFRRDLAGHVTLFGVFPTGGTGVHPIEISLANLPGTLGPYDSDQNLILSADGTKLFAVNSGSDTIAVFDVRKDGSLAPVKGSPFPSGGVNPVSLGLSGGDILVVVNKDYDVARPGFSAPNRTPNYTNFRVNPNGKLIPVPFSTVVAGHGGMGPGSSTPSQALVAPGGDLVFDADTFAANIHSFHVRNNGRLERALTQGTPPSELAPIPPIAQLLPNPTGRPFVLGLGAHPLSPVFYAGFVFEGKAGVYTYNASGNFAFVKSVPAAPGICWIVVSKDGKRVYTSNTLVNSISVLDSTDPLNPVKLQDFQLLGTPAGSEQMALDPQGQFLYVISQKALEGMPSDANALHVLKLAADGTIAMQTDRFVVPVAPSLPQGIAAR